MSGHRLAILGCGIMGEAIVGGLLRAAIFRADEIVATARRPEAAEGLGERHGVAVTLDNLAACRSADTVLLTLKPQRIAKVLHQPGMREALAGKLVISIAAGVTLTQLTDWLPDSAVIRAMPNTPCLIDEGMTVLARGPNINPKLFELLVDTAEPAAVDVVVAAVDEPGARALDLLVLGHADRLARPRRTLSVGRGAGPP